MHDLLHHRLLARRHSIKCISSSRRQTVYCSFSYLDVVRLWLMSHHFPLQLLMLFIFFHRFLMLVFSRHFSYSSGFLFRQSPILAMLSLDFCNFVVILSRLVSNITRLGGFAGQRMCQTAKNFGLQEENINISNPHGKTTNCEIEMGYHRKREIPMDRNREKDGGRMQCFRKK